MQKFIQYLCIFIALSIAHTLHAQTKKTNIILIFVDDLGYADLSIYGQKKLSTPHIDSMARHGKMFTSFYAGSTVCAPSRASLLSGLTTGHSPIRGNKELEGEGQAPLPQNLQTVASILKENGYQTAMFGKWGLGTVTSSGSPNAKGFDEFFGYICQRQAHDYYPTHLWHNNHKILLDANTNKDSIYSAQLIHNKAIEYIEKVDTTNPFFIYLPYTLPHGDVLVPQDSTYWYFVNHFKEKPLTEKQQNARKRSYNEKVELYPRAAFATMVTKLDQYVGEIIQTVKAKGIENNTLILFTSDNGPHNEGGADLAFFNGNGIYRGLKRDLYEGGIREPFIAYMPGTIKPSVVHNHYFALWDLFPTFLDFANINYQSYTIDGVSIKPILLNQKNKQKKHKYLYWEFHEMQGKQAVRYGKWKAVRLNVKKGNKEIELYNLKKDPSEKNNIAYKHPKKVKKLKKIMEEARTDHPDWQLFP